MCRACPVRAAGSAPRSTISATQTILVGTLPNTPANMSDLDPHAASRAPGDVMPNMELTEHDARDVAAYLSTLR